MSSENFCLKWNDHHSVFFTNAEKLCHSSLLTDVVISAGGTLFQAHKLVLSVCSKFFQEVFSQPLLPQSPNTVIYLKDVEAKHMQLLLSYMYKGEVDVEDNELPEFLKTASGLQIKGLSEQDNSNKPKKETSPEKNKLTTSFLNQVDSSVPKSRNPVIPKSPPVVSNVPSQRQLAEEITIEDNPPAKRIKEENVVIEQNEPTSTWNQPKSVATTHSKVTEPQPHNHNNYMVSQTSHEENEFIDEYADYGGEMMYEDEQNLQNFNQTDPGAAWKITHPEDKLNKAYPCEMCSMSFSQKWLLKRHWKTHTGDKPYKCSICLRSFSLRDSCTRHLKTVHKELVMSEDVSNLVEYEDSNVEPNSVISVEYDRSPQPSALVV